MKRILVAFDGSRPSIRAFQYAAGRMEGRRDIELLVIYAQQGVLPSMHITKSMIKDWLASKQRAALSVRVVRDLKKRTKAQVHVKTGDPSAEILEFAQRYKIAEIIMGTRGLGRLKGLVMGSVATKVAHLATVPVTLVK